MKVIPVAIVAGALAGVLTVGLAWRTPPRPVMRAESFEITSPEGTTITPERPLDLLLRYRDFDLNCRVELPPKADLDLLFRKVEHWGEVQDLPIFHTRFSALRMSTRAPGPGFLTREQVLFEPEIGGIEFAPGQSASLELSCRGHRVEAVVNGIELPPIDTIDDFGNIALVCRDGVAVVRDFRVTPWPVAADPLPWLVGGGAGAVLGLLLGVLGASALSMVLSLSLYGGGGLVAGAVLFDRLLPAVAPGTAAVVWGALCLLPAALLIGLRRLPVRWRLLLLLSVGLPAGALLLELGARVDRDRLAAFEDHRMDLVFGPESGTAVFDAVTRMLTCRYTKHTLQSRRYDVLLLGGRTLFDFDDSGGAPGRNVGNALPTALQGKLRQPPERPVTCAVVPTDVANAAQQVAIFRHFYRDYRPKVVVLGLSDDEERVLPRRYQAPPASSGSVLVDALRAGDARSAALPQTPEQLRATLDQLLGVCEQVGSRLVLVLDKSLSRDLQRAALGFCTEHKLGFVVGFDIYQGVYPVAPLAEQVLSQLIR